MRAGQNGRAAREKQVPRCVRNDNSRGKLSKKGKSKSKRRFPDGTLLRLDFGVEELGEAGVFGYAVEV
jgi:hypothetical protein